jgi:hypothetical protein
LCSTTSRELGEDLAGSASTVVSWLLIEQPGAWPRNALDSRHLDHDLAAALARKANAARVRVVLLRRPGRPTPDTDGNVAAFVVHARRRDPWIRRTDLTTVGDALDIDLAAVARGDVPAGHWYDPGPLFAVCTHGRHDPCCAVRGRPVAAALHDAYPQQTWEVSHIGGDRFAANMICFPHAIYLGRLEPDSVVAAADEYAAGRIPLESYRGRACDATAVQVADHALRTTLGIHEIPAVLPLRRTRDGAVGTVETVETVEFAVPAGAAAGSGSRVAAVRLRKTAADPPRRLTCHGRVPQSPARYRVLDVDGRGPA